MTQDATEFSQPKSDNLERFMIISAVVGFIADVITLWTFIIGLNLFNEPSPSPNVSGTGLVLAVWNSGIVRGFSFVVIIYSFIAAIYTTYRHLLRKHFRSTDSLKTPLREDLQKWSHIVFVQDIALAEAVYIALGFFPAMILLWAGVFYVSSALFLVVCIIVGLSSAALTLWPISGYSDTRGFLAAAIITFPIISGLLLIQNISVLVGLPLGVILAFLSALVVWGVHSISTYYLFRLFSSILLPIEDKRTRISTWHEARRRGSDLENLTMAEKWAKLASEAKYSNPDQAIAYFTRALRHEQKAEWLEERAELRWDSGDIEKALQDYTAVTKIASNNREVADIHTKIARRFLETKPDQALEHIGTAIRADPSSYGYETRAEIHNALGNYKSAIQDVDRAIELDENRSSVWFSVLTPSPKARYYLIRGIALLGLGKTEDAVNNLTDAVRRGNLEACVPLATGLQSLQRHSDAVKVLNEFIEEAAAPIFGLFGYFDTYRVGRSLPKRSLPKAYVLRAESLIELGNHDEALADLTKCLSIDRKHDKAYFKRALIQWRLGKLVEATRDFETACEFAPDNLEYWSQWAKLELERSNTDTASEILARAMNANASLIKGLISDPDLAPLIKVDPNNHTLGKDAAT